MFAHFATRNGSKNPFPEEITGRNGAPVGGPGGRQRRLGTYQRHPCRPGRRTSNFCQGRRAPCPGRRGQSGGKAVASQSKLWPLQKNAASSVNQNATMFLSPTVSYTLRLARDVGPARLPTPLLSAARNNGPAASKRAIFRKDIWPIPSLLKNQSGRPKHAKQQDFFTETQTRSRPECWIL